MTRSVVTVTTATNVAQAAALLREHQITSMPVLDEDERVVGIVSEADLLRDRIPRDLSKYPWHEATRQPDPGNLVGEVMQEPVVCLTESADLAGLAAVMLDDNVRAVPITDGSRVVGIVSRRDLLRTLVRNDPDLRQDVLRVISDFAGQPDGWLVDVKDGVVTITGAFDDPAQQKTLGVLVGTVPGVLHVHTRMRRR